MNKLPLKLTRILALTIGVIINYWAVFAIAQTDQDGSDLDRQHFGTTPLPLWSELTNIEVETLTNITNARRGDSHSLLAFYIFAAGDKRTPEEYQNISQRVYNWLNQLPDSITEQRNPEKQAENLLRAMHTAFFLQDSFLQDEESNISGYSLDQTQITKIFDTKHYNCISSAMLYLVLAEHLGLNVDAALMPSHAFVQLTLPGGKRVDIETTSPNGYGIKHDEEFYAGEEEWFTERELEPPSFDDYRSRQIISPFELGLEDMWSQHTDVSRIGYLDRNRLAEVRGYLQPTNEQAQVNRLLFYNREFGNLEAQKDYATLARLFGKIEIYLQDVYFQNFNSSEFWGLYNAVSLAQAFTYVKTDRPDDGLRIAKSLHRNLDKSLQDYESLNNNLYIILNEYSQLKQNNQSFDSARLAYTGIEYDCVRNEVCASGLSQLYGNWGQHYWEKQDWQNTISVFQNYLTIDHELPQTQTMMSNMESAYLNWAGEELNQGEWETADGIYTTCQAALEKAPRCADQQKDLQRKAKRYGY